MNYSKLDPSLSSALNPPPSSTVARAGGRRAAAAPRFRVFVELDEKKPISPDVAAALCIPSPPEGSSVVTAELSSAQVDMASEHPAVQRLTLSKQLRPVAPPAKKSRGGSGA